MKMMTEFLVFRSKRVTIDSFVYLLQCKEPIWYSTQIDVLLQFISEKRTTLQENGNLYYKQFL